MQEEGPRAHPSQHPVSTGLIIIWILPSWESSKDDSGGSADGPQLPRPAHPLEGNFQNYPLPIRVSCGSDAEKVVVGEPSGKPS